MHIFILSGLAENEKSLNTKESFLHLAEVEMLVYQQTNIHFHHVFRRLRFNWSLYWCWAPFF